MVERLFLAVPRGCLQFVIVVFPDHTHLLFFFKWGQNREKHIFGRDLVTIKAKIEKNTFLVGLC